MPSNETHMDQFTQTGSFQQMNQCDKDAKSAEDLGDFSTWIMGKRSKFLPSSIQDTLNPVDYD